MLLRFLGITLDLPREPAEPRSLVTDSDPRFRMRATIAEALKCDDRTLRDGAEPPAALQLFSCCLKRPCNEFCDPLFVVRIRRRDLIDRQRITPPLLPSENSVSGGVRKGRLHRSFRGQRFRIQEL